MLGQVWSLHGSIHGPHVCVGSTHLMDASKNVAGNLLHASTLFYMSVQVQSAMCRQFRCFTRPCPERLLTKRFALSCIQINEKSSSLTRFYQSWSRAADPVRWRSPLLGCRLRTRDNSVPEFLTYQNQPRGSNPSEI